MLERFACLLSNPSGMFQFGLHLPLQKCILPRLLLVCPKRGSEVIFCMFFDLLGTQTLMKCLGSGWAGVFHHKKSKNANLSWFGPPNFKGSARHATCWGQKPVFYTKISKLTKFSPNLLEFGLGVRNQVPCSSKEVLAKIRRRSSSFCRFSALHNLLGSGDCIFDISLKP